MKLFDSELLCINVDFLFVWIDFVAEFDNDLTVNFDATFLDDDLTLTTTGDAGRGHDALQALFTIVLFRGRFLFRSRFFGGPLFRRRGFGVAGGRFGFSSCFAFGLGGDCSLMVCFAGAFSGYSRNELIRWLHDVVEQGLDELVDIELGEVLVGFA